ncbi:MAG: hypothetical protein HZB63_01640, partial [Deltaproteobacteria bacterium]|nr:hypothetical protein [Deltaproteobacteria bacterium]
MTIRPCSRPKACAVAFSVLLLLAGSVISAEEKNVTPLSGGIPMIEGIKMLEAGAAAPNFAIKDTEGKVFNFGEEKAKAPA